MNMTSIVRSARRARGAIFPSMGICGWVFLMPVLAHAQETQSLAKQTQNPVARLVQVPIQGNWDSGIGDRESTSTLVNLQPVMPFPLTKNLNVIARVVMPFASQSTPSGT